MFWLAYSRSLSCAAFSLNALGYNRIDALVAAALPTTFRAASAPALPDALSGLVDGSALLVGEERRWCFLH